jgi:hypothetical protein
VTRILILVLCGLILVASGIAIGRYVAPSTHVASPTSRNSTSSSIQPATVPGVLDCGHTPAQRRPTTITLACADGGTGANHLAWTSWGTTVSTGGGDFFQNDCTPDCADGVILEYPADFTLSVVAQTPAGPVFTVLTATFTGTLPSGDSSTEESWTLEPYGSP